MNQTAALKAFCDRKFGMFIHWGLYSVPGGRHNGRTMDQIGEWFQSYFRMPGAEYAKFAEQFNPVNFDADEWIRKAADAGFKYIVFTSKHHDGFSMFDTKVSDYNVVKMTPFGRDPLKELRLACEKYGLKLGIYYSHDLDWHEKDGGDPGPGTGLNCGVMPVSNVWDFPDYENKNFAGYFYGKVIPQVTELLTNYGEVCELWFDYPASIKPEFSRELRDLVKLLQPDCMINERIGNGFHDFGGLGDNQLLAGKAQMPVEACGTLNDTWAFKYDDHNWKSTEQIIDQLISLTDKNANYLLNVGPMPDGSFTKETDNILAGIGRWIKGREHAVFATKPNPFVQDFDFAYCTVSGCTLNMFLRKKLQKIELNGIYSKVCSCSGGVAFEQHGDKLLLTVSGQACTGFLPLISIVFNEPPKVTDRITVQNGCLLLGMNNAKIVVPGEPDRIWPFLFSSGQIGNWLFMEDYLEWDVTFLKAGKYRVLVRTAPGWMQQWDGPNREMAVCWNSGSPLTGVLKMDADCSTQHEPQYESCLGIMEITEPLHGKIRLKNVRINSEQAGKLYFKSVRLIPEQ